MNRREQTVSEVAKHLKLGRPLASLYLRSLNARGLLEARRTGRKVIYLPHPDETVPGTELLLRSLGQTFRSDTDAVKNVFRLATAFTHPRRIRVIQALHGRPLSVRQLKLKTGVSEDALRRHLKKLTARGFAFQDKGVYYPATPSNPLGRALSALARDSRE